MTIAAFNCAEQFKTFVQQYTNDIFYILVTQIDPDALGSAFALQFILESFGIKSEIFYCGFIGHPQNRAIINRFDLMSRMKSVSEINLDEVETNNKLERVDDNPDTPGYIHYALVDSSTIADGRLLHLKDVINPKIVIDHHRGCDVTVTDDNYVWVEDVGSASTLLIELMKSLNLELNGEDKGLAAVLALGIYTDTHNLKSGGKRDFDAFSFVKEHMSDDDFHRLVEYDLPETFYRNLDRALTSQVVKGERMVSSIGYISPNEGDDLASLADLFIRRSGVALVIVWGIINDKVRISARNTDLTVPLGEFLKNRFGPKSGAKLAPDGRGEGGGIVELDFGFWIGKTNRDEILEVVRKRIDELVFNVEE